MSKTGETEDKLDAVFAAARAHTPTPDAAFLARVLEDAEAVQAEFKEAEALRASERTPVRAPQGLRGVLRALGGWPAVAALSLAMVTGIWIGAAPPEALSVTAQMVWGEGVTLAFEPDLGTDLFPAEEG